MIDLEKLEKGLNELRGLDVIETEREERLAGNTTIELSTSKSFQARLAARALGVNVHDLFELPANEFHLVCVRCFAFLNTPPPTT